MAIAIGASVTVSIPELIIGTFSLISRVKLVEISTSFGNTSDFAVPFVECCKAELPGTHGHIAIGTPDVERAEFHLGLQGTEFLEHTRKVDDKGRTKAIYLNQTFAGFAVHLMRK